MLSQRPFTLKTEPLIQAYRRLVVRVDLKLQPCKVEPVICLQSVAEASIPALKKIPGMVNIHDISDGGGAGTYRLNMSVRAGGKFWPLS